MSKHPITDANISFAFPEHVRAEVSRRLEEDRAALVEVATALYNHLEWIGWGDSYERECIIEDGLPERARALLKRLEEQ